MQVVKELRRLGYQLDIKGAGAAAKISCKFTGNQPPDPAIIKPLLDELRARKTEAVDFLLSRKQSRGKVIVFPYPINETLGIGDFDPMDVRYIDGKPVLEPGWWKDIKNRKGETHD